MRGALIITAGEGIAQLNSSAAKQREAELLLDDSDSDMEADVVFAHVMARQHGARLEQAQPAEHLHSSSWPPEGSQHAVRADDVEPPYQSATPPASLDGESRERLESDLENGEEVPGLSAHESSTAEIGGDAVPQLLSSKEAGMAGKEEPAAESPAEPEPQADSQQPSRGPSLQRVSSQARGKKPSQKAVAAMWELLECSIAPQLQLSAGVHAPGNLPLLPTCCLI